MLTVVYDSQDGRVEKSVFDAASEQYVFATDLRGLDWVKENYTPDKALEDYMSGNFAWLELDGRKLMQVVGERRECE